jgi:hypothetical protein
MRYFLGRISRFLASCCENPELKTPVEFATLPSFIKGDY